MSQKEPTSRARALADLDAGAILATVDIAVPMERVFRALTDPRELMQWWGSPETYRAHAWEADFRVGGKWRVDGKSADGRPYSVEGRFLEIEPPRRVVQTWQYDWDANSPETRLTYTLDEVAGGTRVTVRHEGFVPRSEACRSHASGWERVLDWLTSHLENLARPGL
jgi:uncharacterized protein YndB with AHSA1/START domain